MGYKETLEKLKTRMTRAREVAEEKMGVAVAAVEVTATAGGLAYLRGRYPSTYKDEETGEEKESSQILVMGLPVNLLLGIGGHGLGLFGAAGKYSEHVHNISSGALADYASSTLFDMGKKNKETADKESGTAKVAGYPQAASLPSPAPFSPYNPAARMASHPFVY